MRHDATQGSIKRTILAIAGPIVGANMLQSAYQIIDTFWVGRLGAQAVAAVSLSFPVLFVILSLGAGLAIAGSVLAAHAAGRKNQRELDHSATQAALFIGTVSLVLCAIGILITPLAIRYLGADQSVYPLAVEYLRISFYGLPFLFGYFTYMSITRGIGEVRIPLYIVAGTVILNLILDPLFIYGLGPIEAHGVAGAAIASVITQGLSALIGLGLLVRGVHGVRLHWRDAIWEPATLKKIIGIGAPASLDQTVRASGLLIMAGIVAMLGTQVLAAYGIGLRIFSFIIIPAVGLMMATSTIVGQNLGADQQDRAERGVLLSMKYAFFTLSAVGAVLFFLAGPIVGFFIQGEPDVVRMGTKFLKIMAFSFGFLGVQFAIAGAFRGSGHTIKALTITAVTLFIIELPLAYILGLHTPLRELGIWLSIPAANILGCAIGYAWLRRGSWKIPTRHTMQQ